MRIIKKYQNSQYTPNLLYAFKTEDDKFILLFNLMQGGDLYKHLSLKQRFSESDAKFIFISILLALEYFHSQKLIYGDLKPENILIDVDGYMRLTDLGFAR